MTSFFSGWEWSGSTFLSLSILFCWNIEGGSGIIRKNFRLEVILCDSGSCIVGDESWKMSNYASDFAIDKRELYSTMVAGNGKILRSQFCKAAFWTLQIKSKQIAILPQEVHQIEEKDANSMLSANASHSSWIIMHKFKGKLIMLVLFEGKDNTVFS